MGSWGIKIFENDAAGEWVNHFTENPSIQLLSSTIDCVNNEEDYLEVDASQECLAAAETIAAIRGKPSDEFEKLEDISLKDLQIEFKGSISEELINSAVTAVEKIKASESNELKSLMEEENYQQQWIDILSDLLTRLKA